LPLASKRPECYIRFQLFEHLRDVQRIRLLCVGAENLGRDRGLDSGFLTEAFHRGYSCKSLGVVMATSMKRDDVPKKDVRRSRGKLLITRGCSFVLVPNEKRKRSPCLMMAPWIEGDHLVDEGSCDSWVTMSFTLTETKRRERMYREVWHRESDRLHVCFFDFAAGVFRAARVV